MDKYNDITDKIRRDVYPAIDPKTTLKGSASGKTVLVTGAGRGIGKAIAVAFGYAGASTIIITSRSAPELATAREEILAAGRGANVITHTTDVTSEESVKALFEMLASSSLVLDVLVNNAGYAEGALAGMGSPASWWRDWEINVKGTYLPTHFALKTLSAPLTVICTTSNTAFLTMPGISAYSAGKAGVNRFVEYVDAEYGDKGVRAFSVHPGSVKTKLASGLLPPQLHHLLALIGDTPELAAGFYVWLATQKTADHFKGKYLSAEWDVDAIVAIAEAKSAEDKGRWLTQKLIV